MKLTFRIDDVTPTMNWDNFYKMMKMLSKYGVKPILGVIPSCRDQKLLKYPENMNFWDDMVRFQEKGSMIALHGYEHLYVTSNAGIFPVNNYSEFAGLSYIKQYEKIKRGKQILEAHGLKTDLFMAPAHSFDENTCRALLENDIHSITDGFGSAVYRRYGGILFLPVALIWRRAVRLNHWDTCTLVVHTNSMTDGIFEKYKEICEKNRDNLFSWDYLKMKQCKVGKYSRFIEKKEFAMYGILEMMSKAKNCMQ